MPQEAWSKKRERQYEHIKEGLEERGRDEDTADLIVSTAHKAKGREWDSVRIANDFKAPQEDEEPRGGDGRHERAPQHAAAAGVGLGGGADDATRAARGGRRGRSRTRKR